MSVEENAPLLSTPAEHILEHETRSLPSGRHHHLSEEQLDLQYEIKRTIAEIRTGRWKRIALQFPDDMLVDAPRVFERLRDGLRLARLEAMDGKQALTTTTVETLAANSNPAEAGDGDEKLCILGDTSYGACCVDEIAAEHVDADVVVHYGRACLSPTARLPVIYVYTAQALDVDAAVRSFQNTYPSTNEKVCLMADIPYSYHLQALYNQLQIAGYSQIFKTDIVRDPSSLIPNRTIPLAATQDTEALKDFGIFHISAPPTSLLLILSSRIKSLHILSTDPEEEAQGTAAAALESNTATQLRRRYALITRLSTVPIFGILINTLSVTNYMAALQHCQELIAAAGKKSYVFVVGKVNAAKVANFSEIGGWVVIGCWESSLIESKDFYRPIITPFELEVALADDRSRTWGGEWIGDFSALLGKESRGFGDGVAAAANEKPDDDGDGIGAAGGEDFSDGEPPEFDLRTGRYVSHSRPMGRPRLATAGSPNSHSASIASPPSSALVHRAKADVMTINGQVSPAAEFLRSQRTWQGLGSDHEIAYERDEHGRIRGAVMEEGRSGIAQGYTVGVDQSKS